MKPNDAYMHRWTRPSLVQVMACRLFGTKPLPKPMLTYCQLDPQEQTSFKFQSVFKHFHSGKSIWKWCLLHGSHFDYASMCWETPGKAIVQEKILFVLTHWPLRKLDAILPSITLQFWQFSDNKSTMVQVMAWCHQAASDYLSQCWPRFVSPHGITMSQQTNAWNPHQKFVPLFQFTESQHWFRWWLGNKQAPGHYQTHWPSAMMFMCHSAPKW